MKIVFSFWSKPLQDGNGGFAKTSDMVNSLIVAVNCAKLHYEKVEFYTDSWGLKLYELFKDQLPFTAVHNVLDCLNNYSIHCWSISKVYVYSLQQEPFIHIDNDFYIWEKFPDQVFESDFFFQETESFSNPMFSFYNKGLAVFGKYMPSDVVNHGAAVNCGVFGCCNEHALLLIKKYYEKAGAFAWAINTNCIGVIDKATLWFVPVLIEQYIIYSLMKAGGFTYDILLKKYQFRFTHLLASSKRKLSNALNVAKRVAENNFNLKQ